MRFNIWIEYIELKFTSAVKRKHAYTGDWRIKLRAFEIWVRWWMCPPAQLLSFNAFFVIAINKNLFYFFALFFNFLLSRKLKTPYNKCKGRIRQEVAIWTSPINCLLMEVCCRYNWPFTYAKPLILNLADYYLPHENEPFLMSAISSSTSCF